MIVASLIIAGGIGAAFGYVFGHTSYCRLYAPERDHLQIRRLGLSRAWDTDEEPAEWSVRGPTFVRYQTLRRAA